LGFHLFVLGEPLTLIWWETENTYRMFREISQQAGKVHHFFCMKKAELCSERTQSCYWGKWE